MILLELADLDKKLQGIYDLKDPEEAKKQLDDLIQRAANPDEVTPEKEANDSSATTPSASIIGLLGALGAPEEVTDRVSGGIKTLENQFGPLEEVMEKAEVQFKSYISGIIREAIRDMVPEIALAIGSVVIEDQPTSTGSPSQTEEAVSLREEISRLEASLQDT